MRLKTTDLHSSGCVNEDDVDLRRSCVVDRLHRDTSRVLAVTLLVKLD
jgi:hypothetical protein